MDNKQKVRELNEHTIIRNEDTVPVIAFKSFEDIEWIGCGFSTRLGGVSKNEFSTMNMSFARGDDPEDVHENIRRFSASAGFDPKGIVMPHQCHTINVEIVGKNDAGRGVYKSGTEEEIDGQITNEPGVVLYCLGADCVPVFLVDTVKRVVAAVHAGWKGTLNNIVYACIKKMKLEFGTEAENIRAVIGPSICGNCYEVSPDVAIPFMEKYGEAKIESENIVKKAEPFDPENPKFFLNLWTANKENLIMSGVKKENIEISGYCTRCHPDMLFSHRYHGDKRGGHIGYIFFSN